MGVGGGIVYDSDPAAEYAECLLKAAFLTRAQPPFDLIETLLWSDGYTLLPLHLDRLRLSCEYFDRPFDSAEIEARLHALAATFAPLSRHRVRLTLGPRGQIALTSSPLAPSPTECRVTIAHERTTSTDVFLRHKTTHRPLYDRLFAAAQQSGFDEVLFRNQRDEVTEGAISNIFVRIEGRLYTPPLACGVLPWRLPPSPAGGRPARRRTHPDARRPPRRRRTLPLQLRPRPASRHAPRTCL